MAFREFTDRGGVMWTVWDLRPGSTQLLLAGADYPAEYYRTGWLSFQTQLGTDQRVLAPIPPGWETAPDVRLCELLERATSVRASRAKAGEGISLWEKHGRPVADRDLPESFVVRAFVHPAGRAWTVYVTTPEDGGPPVLRFSSGGRSVDVTEWPTEWAQLPDDSLVELLRRVPRTSLPPGPTTPRRRWNDPRP